MPFRKVTPSPSQILGDGPTITDEGPKVTRISTGYKPRALQKELHLQIRRFNVLVCHRRFGKTVGVINHMIDRAMTNPLRNPQYAYIAPTYKQAKRIAWQFFIDYTRKVPGVRLNKTDLIIYIERPNRLHPAYVGKSELALRTEYLEVYGQPPKENANVEWLLGKLDAFDPDTISLMLIGADDPDTLRGLFLDGAILDEFAQCDPIIWGQIVRPALADRSKAAKELGVFDHPDYFEPWAIFIGTPKGKNHFWRRYKKAQRNEEFCKRYEDEFNIEEQQADWDDFEETHGIHEFLPEVELNRILKTLSKTIVAQYSGWRTYRTSRHWFTCIYKASETGVLSQEEIDDMREDMTKEEIEQELECSFSAAILGSYYGAIINQLTVDQHITNLPYNPKYPVDTYWDIGVGDKTTIWFVQKIAGKVHYIDYYEKNGVGVSHYKGMLDAKAGVRTSRVEIDDGEFMSGEGYKYGRHVWPHDGAVREFGTGQSRQETARSLGLIVTLQTKQSVEDRIQASRNRLKVSLFDEKKCARGLECLYNYQKEWDDKLMMFKQKPKHDWSSHGSDSFGYSALDDRPSGFPHDRERNQQQFVDSDYDELVA